MCQLLIQYWNWANIAVRAGGYYRDPLQGYHCVTQGYPLSLRIFNVVVDEIFFPWLGLTADNEARPESFGYTMAEKTEFFYVDDGLFASTNLV